MADKIKVLQINRPDNNEVKSVDGKKVFSPVAEPWYAETADTSQTMGFEETLEFNKKNNLEQADEPKITLIQNANSHFLRKHKDFDFNLNRQDFANNQFETIKVVDQNSAQHQSKLPESILQLRRDTYANEQAQKDDLIDKLNQPNCLGVHPKNMVLARQDGEKDRSRVEELRKSLISNPELHEKQITPNQNRQMSDLFKDIDLPKPTQLQENIFEEIEADLAAKQIQPTPAVKSISDATREDLEKILNPSTTGSQEPKVEPIFEDPNKETQTPEQPVVVTEPKPELTLEPENVEELKAESFIPEESKITEEVPKTSDQATLSEKTEPENQVEKATSAVEQPQVIEEQPSANEPKTERAVLKESQTVVEEKPSGELENEIQESTEKTKPAVVAPTIQLTSKAPKVVDAENPLDLFEQKLASFKEKEKTETLNQSQKSNEEILRDIENELTESARIMSPAETFKQKTITPHQLDTSILDYTVADQTDDMDREIAKRTENKKRNKLEAENNTTAMLNNIVSFADKNKKASEKAFLFQEYENWFGESKEIQKLGKLTKKEKKRMEKEAKRK